MTLPPGIARPQAILFDWDNTLVDNWGAICDALNTTFAAFGKPPWTLVETKARVRESLRDSFPKMFGARWPEARDIFYRRFATKHIETLAAWQKDNIFKYGGREGRSTALFTAGECAIHIASSGSAGAIQAAFKDRQFGIAMMPYYPDAIAKPQNSTIGGATLWVLQKKAKEEYKGVAKFFTFLSDVDRQVKLHTESGYLPITKAAYEKVKASGFYKDKPYLETPILELTNKAPTDNSKGLRYGSLVQIRDIWSEELEAALNGQKSPQAALDAAVERGNQMLRQFERTASR